MERPDFIGLVSGLENQAQRDPSAYRAKVLLLALGGYGYVLLLLAAALASAAGVVADLARGSELSKLGALWAVLAVSFALILVRALWVRLTVPEGIELGPEQAPRLFGLLRKLRRSLATDGVDHVLISSGFNAGIVQLPRFGPLGRSRNYLVIGLPLMMCLSRRQFAAVLAHEFGHIAGNHSRFGGWVYRLRQSWVRILQRLHSEEHPLSFAFLWFFRWYAPYFHAHAYVLARQDEYEADAASRGLFGRQGLAEGLIEGRVKARFLRDDYWPKIFAQADSHERPDWMPYARMQSAVRVGFDREAAADWLEDELEAATDYDDTHPSLRDRIVALRAKPRLAEPFARSAADAYLAPLLPELTAKLDEEWWEEIEDEWTHRHATAREARRRIAELQAAGDRLGADERYELAELIQQFAPGDDAQRAYRAVLQQAPHHSEALFALGWLLLDEGDDAGVGLLEEVLRADPNLALRACERIVVFLHDAGRAEHLRVYMRRLRQLQAEERRVHRRLARGRFADGAVAHGLSSRQLGQVTDALLRTGRVREAWLVRKDIPAMPGRRAYLLLVKPVRGGGGDDLVEHLIESVPLPGAFMVVPLQRRERFAARRIAHVPDARLLPRP